jgi:hypothetical protein
MQSQDAADSTIPRFSADNNNNMADAKTRDRGKIFAALHLRSMNDVEKPY